MVIFLCGGLLSFILDLDLIQDSVVPSNYHNKHRLTGKQCGPVLNCLNIKWRFKWRFLTVSPQYTIH